MTTMIGRPSGAPHEGEPVETLLVDTHVVSDEEFGQIEHWMETITPARAIELLEDNRNNRPINDVTVQKYARDMKEGRWRTTGNTISVAPDGTLLNGQHRLWAVVMSGTTQRFLMVKETDHAVKYLIDIGRTKNASQFLRMDGVKDSAVKQGIARFTLMWDADKTNLWHTSLYTQTEVMEFVWANMDSLDAMSHYGKEFRENFRKGMNWYAAVAWIILRDSKHADRWDEFHQGVVQGIGLSEGDPRLVLRRYITRNDAAKTQWDNQQRIGMTILAWNKWLHGDKGVKLLRFTRGNLPMPVVK